MIQKIDLDEFLELRDSKKSDIKVVDVLSEEHFEKEHIPGAISLPVGKIDSHAGEQLNKNDRVIVYCANTECDASPKAAEKLEAMGFTNIYDYEGGIEDYKNAGLPLEGSSHPQEAKR